MNLTSPEALDKLIYELQDRFVDLKRIQAHLRGIARYRQRPERCFFGSAAPAWRIEWGALVCELLTHDTGATAGGCLLHRQRGTRAKLVRSRQ